MPPWFVFILVLWIGLSLNAFAYEHQNPPYKKGRTPSSCKIHSIKGVAVAKNIRRFELKDKHQTLSLSLRKIIDRQAYGLFSELKAKSPKGQARLLHPYSWVGLSPKYLDNVYWAYLNQDNKKDLIVNTRFASIGKLNGFEVTTFYLSTPKGYVAKQLLSYKLEAADFLDYTNDNKCEYLHLSYVYGSDKADQKGKRYNYWNYNILRFDGGEIKLSNRLSRYFPKWITHVRGYNDKNTKWLSKKKKKQLWQQHEQELGGLVASPDTLDACRKMPNRFSAC